jgi:MOSC domain-containing protein YiiM
VTVIAAETFERIRQDLPSARPVMRRANLMIRGVPLEGCRGSVLAVGDVRILVRGETRPCNLMDEQCMGLRTALDPGWGGGVHGSVLRGGALRVGDPVSMSTQTGPAGEGAGG